MNPRDKDTKEKAAEQEKPKAENVKLSTDFFEKLLHTPPCKTGGECNNCGRCEH